LASDHDDDPWVERTDLVYPGPIGEVFAAVLPTPAVHSGRDLPYGYLLVTVGPPGEAAGTLSSGQVGFKEGGVELDPACTPVLPPSATPPIVLIGLTGMLSLVGYRLWPRRPQRRSRFA